MIPDYLLCDVCGEKIDKNSRLTVEIGGYLDCDSDYRATRESLEFCNEHLIELITKFMKNDTLANDWNHKNAERLIKIGKRMIKDHKVLTGALND